MAGSKDWQSGETQWNEAKQLFLVGSIVQVVVTKQEVFGVFVSLPNESLGLIRLPELIRRDQTIEDYPAVGTVLNARVLGFDEHNRQVILTTK